MAEPVPDVDSGPGTAPDERDYRNLRQLSRALAMLEMIATGPMRPTDVAQRLALPWASVYRTISQLTKDGFLLRDEETGQYQIGPRMWFIGTSYVTNHRVLHTAQPHLEAFAERVDATVQLCERSGRQVVPLFSHHVARSEVITKTTYGHHFPLHCGAKGQVLLAYADPGFVEWYLEQPLERLTSETIVDPDVLRQRLARIRQDGYTVSAGDVQSFTGSVAVPVFDRSGAVSSSVCAIVRRSKLEEPGEPAHLIEEVLSTARAISFALGWAPHADTPAARSYR